jgi:thioredoxin 1
MNFWAEWCPYCVRLKPIFESTATDYQDIKFVKVNVQAVADIASRYEIRGIPVIKFFCEGKEVGEIGFVPENVLKKRIEEISKNAPGCLSNTSIRR